MDVTITDCKFGVVIVPYMYGELAETERASFESHLLECSLCTDEFATISHARYEVYDWKQSEFDALATPVIRIPYKESGAGVGWMDKVRAVFGNSWAVPGAAVAGIAIISVLAAFYLSSREANVLVGKIGNSNDAVIESPLRPTTVPVSEGEATPAARPISAPPKAVKASSTGASEKRREVTGVRAPAPRRIEQKQASARAKPRTVPTLSGFPEDEDKSLRLAELLEDIDTSE